MYYNQLAHRILKGIGLSQKEALEILNSPDEIIMEIIAGAYMIRRKYFKNWISIQLLKNAKSGNCTEDCHYCSQSSISNAEITAYPLVSPEKLVESAEKARAIQAKRYCMALSGGFVSDQEIDDLCQSVSEIKNRGALEICCSLGFMTLKQAQRLKAAGLDRVNHNLNTSSSYYSQICSSHTYRERVDNIRRCKEAGLEICSGGIIGQGESNQDIVDFFFELKQIDPQSIPLNFLIPIKGTPFGKMDTTLTPVKCLKILALARYIHPQKEIRLAGGREYHLKSLQPLAFYMINSIFVRGYLTTSGDGEEEAISMIRDAGFDLEVEISD